MQIILAAQESLLRKSVNNQRPKRDSCSRLSLSISTVKKSRQTRTASIKQT